MNQQIKFESGGINITTEDTVKLQLFNEQNLLTEKVEFPKTYLRAVIEALTDNDEFCEVQTLYTFDQLSEKAKEKAISDFAEHSPYPWSYENEDCLKEFADIVGVKIIDWEYGYSCPSVDYSDNLDDSICDLSGKRLISFLVSKFWSTLYTRKKYYKNKSYVTGLPKPSSCPLTGYCVDEDLLQPIRDAIAKGYSGTYEDLIKDCFHAWGKACEKDLEYYYSEEAIAENSEANGYKYYINGKLA